MKLRNKKTGEIPDEIETIGYNQLSKQIMIVYIENDGRRMLNYYDSLEEFNEEWEDYIEEPKGSALDLLVLTVTNFIENEPDEDKVDLEDCKQMLEKIKAWRRLKDKGFKFSGYNACSVDYDIDEQYRKYISKDLDLLFGSEE